MTTTETAGSAVLTSHAGRALRWSFLNTLASKLGTMAVGILLARLLGPAEFGTFAVATVALAALLSCNELGVSLAVVRWAEDPREIAPTVATLSVLSSALMTGAMVLLAPSFCMQMGSPDATPVVRLMALSVLVSGLVATPVALLQRGFRQRERTIVDQLSIWLGTLCSLSLAFVGWGAMSLAVGRVTGAVVGAVAFGFLCRDGYRFGLRRAALPALLVFGLPLAGTSILVFAVGYVDQLVVGSVLGATTLGFYVLAFNLSSWPVTIFSLPLRGVAPAVFARLRGDVESTRREFRRLLELLMSLSLPVCATLAGSAWPVVHVVYGSAWAPAALALRFLAIGAAVRIFGELAYDYLVINGRTRSLFAVQSLWLLVLVPALLLGSHVDGLRGAAVAQAGVLALIGPAYIALLCRHGLRWRDVGSALAVPLLVSVAAGFAMAGIGASVGSPLLACVLSGCVGALTAGLLVWRRRATLSQLVLSRRSA